MKDDSLATEIAAKEKQDAEVQRILAEHPNLSLADIDKVKSLEEMHAIRNEMEAAGKKLVITSGCFDVLHAGHRAYLPQARECGDALVVALNNDASVRELKGHGRPVRPVEIRAFLLAALDCVDYVTVFESRSVAEPIRQIQPHVYAKGGDYTLDSIHADVREVLEAAGTEARFLAHLPGVSTTKILEQEKKEA